MINIVFAQESIFHLYRLGHVVFGTSGVRFSLSNQDDMNALIRYCDRCKDPSISRQFDAFLNSADQSVIDFLVNKKLVRPRRLTDTIAA